MNSKQETTDKNNNNKNIEKNGDKKWRDKNKKQNNGSKSENITNKKKNGKDNKENKNDADYNNNNENDGSSENRNRSINNNYEKNVLESDLFEEEIREGCICHRPRKTFECESCHHFFFGRPSTICEVHPKDFFLMDFPNCPYCSAPTTNAKASELSWEMLRKIEDAKLPTDDDL